MKSAAPVFRSDLLAQLRRYRYGLISLVTVLFLLLPNLLVSAQAQVQPGYPPFRDPYLNDYGHVVEASDAATIRATLQQYQQQTGIHAVVTTINSVQDYSTGDSTIESFATHLFNAWGIGDRTRNDGILLLVVPGDRQVRIELGRGYPLSYTPIAQAIISDYILPHFREGRISQGTVAGASAIVSRFTSTSQDSAMMVPAPVEGGSFSDSSQPSQNVFSGDLTALLVGFGALIVGLFGLSHWHRKRQVSNSTSKPLNVKTAETPAHSPSHKRSSSNNSPAKKSSSRTKHLSSNKYSSGSNYSSNDSYSSGSNYSSNDSYSSGSNYSSNDSYSSGSSDYSSGGQSSGDGASGNW